MALAPGDAPLVKSSLDRLMRAYGPAHLDSDPLGLVHAYPRRADREAAAFFAAALAFGNAKAVRASLRRVFGRLGGRPAETLLGFEMKKDGKLFNGIVHRWVGSAGLARFAHMTGAALREFGSLEAAFMLDYDPSAATLTGALAAFRGRLHALAPGSAAKKPDGFDYLMPDPSGQGACKRLHLFLKWMVRRDDGVDLGLWRTPRPDQLVIPLDTHIARIGGLLGLTDRRTPDRRMAEEITASLKLLNPDDPAAYDFAISRLGILGHCPRRPDILLCAGCPLQDICRHWRGVPEKKKRAALARAASRRGETS